MIQTLIREVEGVGCAVTCEGNNLKLHDSRPLTDEHKSMLKAVKTDILDLFEQQELARRTGWMVYPYGEAYEMRVGRNSAVYIFLEDNGTYTAWRATWLDKNYPKSEKVIIKGADFDTAFERANNYANWFRK